MKSRSVTVPDDPVPIALLRCMDPELVSKWLCKYIMETRQDSGSPYPPKILYSLLCGLLRISRANCVAFNFLDRSDIRFQEFHKTLDSVCSSLHTQGIGAKTNSASVISYED